VCTFNTLLLPASVGIEAVNPIAHEVLGLTFTAQGNLTIERGVAADALSYIKDKHCDCGMGLAERPPALKRAPTDREVRKLRLAGWGDAKIQRWIAQRTATQQKHAAERDRHHEASLAKADEWAAFVRRVFEERLSPWVGLFTHDYHGSVHTERIDIENVRRFVGVTAEQVALMEQDVPFVFAAR
jgi:hypothetical protein